MRLHTLVAIAVMVCALPAVAADPAPAPRAPYATKVFAVADLLGGPGDRARKGERLARLVTSYVRPHSWGDKGGPATAEFYEAEAALVVTNTADVLQEMSDLLSVFRRIQAGGVPAAVAEPFASQLRAAQNPPPVAPAPRPAAKSVAVKPS